MNDCHQTENHSNCHGETTSKKDYFFIGLIVLGVTLYTGHILDMNFEILSNQFKHLFHSFFEIINTMSWGVFLGVISVGLLGRVPREYIISVLGQPGKFSSLIKATGAGLLLDLCSHGILMVGMKLYERGASTAQVMAFLIASPWNSLSLTIILVTLIGLKWTLTFIIFSAVIALVSGLIFDLLEKKGILPSNPHKVEIPEDFKLLKNIRNDLKSYQFSKQDIGKLLIAGIKDSKMIIKWLLFGAILSSFIQAFVDQDVLQAYFGPTILGLLATLVITTILEVCSEGASPIAADLINRAGAPGNSFTFLMAGVATDYTEILSLKSTTKSWKVALFLPLVTVPQVLVIGYILNQ